MDFDLQKGQYLMFDKRLKCHKNAHNNNKTTEKLELKKKLSEKKRFRRNKGEFLQLPMKLSQSIQKNVRNKNKYKAITQSPKPKC